jgi:hypothetical protein
MSQARLEARGGVASKSLVAQSGLAVAFCPFRAKPLSILVSGSDLGPQLLDLILLAPFLVMSSLLAN